MDALVQRLTSPTILGPLCFTMILSLYSYWFTPSQVPRELPWIGLKPGRLLARPKAYLSGMVNHKALIIEGYQRYTKQGKAYVYPKFSSAMQICLPKEHMKWLIDQPDSVLSADAAQYETLQGDYNFGNRHVIQDKFHEAFIFRHLPRHLSSLLMDIWGEVEHAIDDTWGMDTENWKEICIYDNLVDVASRVSNILFVGRALNREQGFLRNMQGFAQDVAINLAILPLFPKFLQPIAGPIITMPNRYHWRKTQKYSIPVIKQRMADLERKATDPNFDWEEPNDYISWHIKAAKAANKPKELDLDIISLRLMALNFAAIHTTAITFSNVLLDLFSSDPACNYLFEIREEAMRVFDEENGIWTKQSLSRLTKADSAIRESMRVSPFFTLGMMRKVVAPDGVKAPAGAEWKTIPRGAFVGTDVYGIMHDSDNYRDAHTYDAFRFSRERELLGDKKDEVGGNVQNQDVLKSKNLGLFTTSETYLPFGHGRHACPGRFFASHEMKMLLAYMLSNYEIEPIKERPPNKWIASTVIPPMKQTVRIRRRKAADCLRNNGGTVN